MVNNINIVDAPNDKIPIYIFQYAMKCHHNEDKIHVENNLAGDGTLLKHLF